MNHSHRCKTSLVFPMILLALSTGCGYIESFFGEEKKPPAPPPKVVDKTPEPPPPPPQPRNGVRLKFSTGDEFVANDCFVKVVPAAGGRPPVLQVASYADPSTESFPSIFMSGVAPKDTLEEMKGEIIQMKIWLTDAADGPEATVWFTPDTTPAVITIKTVDDTGRIVGEVIEGLLKSSDVEESDQIKVTGQFDGELKK